jgi:hypothetical protein
MFTLQNIKDKYYLDLAYGLVDVDFNTYLQENYVRTYDINLNFVGWDLK